MKKLKGELPISKKSAVYCISSNALMPYTLNSLRTYRSEHFRSYLFASHQPSDL